MQAVLRAYQERAALMMQRAWRRRRLRKRRAPNQKLVVRAIPDFTASEPTDLPGFSVGMMIVVIDKQGGGDWWKGYLSANPQKCGEFPSNYVEEEEEEVVNPVVSETHDAHGDNTDSSRRSR